MLHLIKLKEDSRGSNALAKRLQIDTRICFQLIGKLTSLSLTNSVEWQNYTSIRYWVFHSKILTSNL